ncbi:MAG: dehydrogenase [Firmicutes bacterium]|nr:dehydrogenase [Bacillota bacterium]
MKIEQLKEKLENLKYSTGIKNRNELYAYVPKSAAVDVATMLYTAHKLNFAAEFCQQKTGEDGFFISILFISRKHNYYVVIRYETEDTLMSIQDLVFQAHLFEREISDLYGLGIAGGKDARNLVKHEAWESGVYPLKKDFPYGTKIKERNETGKYEFKGLSGEGGYQIAVGPVHAGIIEPGHFRFSAIGESIENLEIRLMYKHRGIEKMMENVDADKLSLVFERVSGESAAAYSEGYAHLVESLNGWQVSEDIKALRVAFLELERACNFLEDIAGICVDIGFSYPAKKFSYFSELIRQLCERVTGSRFLRNSIIPCGNNVEFGGDKAVDIVDTIDGIVHRFNRIVEMTLVSVSFLDRVENTGIIRNDNAVKLCMTGVSGRASGIVYDVRNSFSYELYPKLKKPVQTETLGGVFERYKLKIEEIRSAFDYIKSSLDFIGGRTVPKERNSISLQAGQEAIVSVETVKGDLIIYGLTGMDNRFDRIYMKTPSFANWRGLTYAVMGEIVPDFPLCNKSMNMSYSENDR